MSAHPMVPSDEAKPETLALACAQGEPLAQAPDCMTEEATSGAALAVGDDRIADAVEEAGGHYRPGKDGGGPAWVELTDGNVHLEVAACDAADGRFLPGLTVFATLIGAKGAEIGTHR